MIFLPPLGVLGRMPVLRTPQGEKETEFHECRLGPKAGSLARFARSKGAQNPAARMTGELSTVSPEFAPSLSKPRSEPEFRRRAGSDSARFV